MVLLHLRANGGDAFVPFEVKPDVHLRDVQSELCRLFRQRFPTTMAVVFIDGTTFDGFQTQPFAACSDGQEVLVHFQQTDDPFFFDLADRRGPRATVEDQFHFEAAVDAGDTAASAIGLEQWAAHRRSKGFR
jgi:hypothetical protein